MTSRNPKIAEYRQTRDRLYGELREQIQAIRAMAWLAHHAWESNRTSYSNADYADSVSDAMEHILKCASQADGLIYGEIQQNSLDYLIFELDRLEDMK